MEDQSIPPALLIAMREAAPLPPGVAVMPCWGASARTLVCGRLREETCRHALTMLVNALARLLGFRFARRISNLGDCKLLPIRADVDWLAEVLWP